MNLPLTSVKCSGLYAAFRTGQRLDLGAFLLRSLPKVALHLQGGARNPHPSGMLLRGGADPDDNGVEMYWDRAVDQWPQNQNGELAMVTLPLDLHALLAEADVPDTTLGPADLA